MAFIAICVSTTHKTPTLPNLADLVQSRQYLAPSLKRILKFVFGCYRLLVHNFVESFSPDHQAQPSLRDFGFVIHAVFYTPGLKNSMGGIMGDRRSNPIMVKRPTRAGRLSHLSPNLSQGNLLITLETNYLILLFG